MSHQYKPDLYVVLEAIARGIDTRNRISEELGLQRERVDEILASLDAMGLIARTARGLIIKREAYTLTPSGWRVLDEWRERARRDLEKAEDLRRAGREEAMEVLQPYLAFLPFLLALEHLSIVGLYSFLASDQILYDQLDTGSEDYSGDFEAAEDL